MSQATRNNTQPVQLVQYGMFPVSSSRKVAFITLYLNQIHANPPLVSVTISTEAGKDKDTSANIQETKEFTVNIISVPFVDNANACSIDAPHDVSEWPISGLTKAPSV